MRARWRGLVAAMFAACGGGGGGGATHPDLPATATTAATGLTGLQDATPTASGSAIYFLAVANDEPAVLRASGGSAAPVPVLVGPPLGDPVGIAMSPDDGTLFIADTAAGSGGEIIAISLATGSATELAGTAGLAPQGIDAILDGGALTLYFTGLAAEQPAAFTSAADGTGVTMIAHGAPLVTPGGIAAVGSGEAYVSDAGPPAQFGEVLHIRAGSASQLGVSYTVGTPAGAALTMDGDFVVTSGLTEEDTSEIVFTPIDGSAQFSYDAAIAGETAAGGIHRARDAEVFAWAGIAPQQTVYELQ